MDLSEPASRAGAGPHDELPLLPGALHRMVQLTQLRDWCMQRLSELSVSGRMDEARSLTAEHLEMLETVDAHRTLWMSCEEDD